MKEIKLTKGFVALVDDEDYEYLNRWKWGVSKSQRGVRYACRSVNNEVRKYIIMHRLIMKPPSNMSIDHINHNGLDNRKCNLRIVTHRENMQNIKRKTITGLTGVSINCKNKFRATIYINHRQVHLGYFNTPEEAHNAYTIAFRELPEPYKPQERTGP